MAGAPGACHRLSCDQQELYLELQLVPSAQWEGRQRTLVVLILQTKLGRSCTKLQLDKLAHEGGALVFPQGLKGWKREEQSHSQRPDCGNPRNPSCQGHPSQLLPCPRGSGRQGPGLEGAGHGFPRVPDSSPCSAHAAPRPHREQSPPQPGQRLQLRARHLQLPPAAPAATRAAALTHPR